MQVKPTPCEVRVTHTDKSSTVTTITESLESPGRRVLALRAYSTQSVGIGRVSLTLDNRGGTYSAWESGDQVKVEVRRLVDDAYTTLLEGVLGEPVRRPGPRQVLEASVHHPDIVLDLVTLDADISFQEQTWTSMWSSLITGNLSGYTPSTDTSTETGSISLQAGMKLREALDVVRRGLIAATGNRWEHALAWSGATRTASLYERDAVSQGTIKAAEVLDGGSVAGGAIEDVVNDAIVVGAEVAEGVIDHTGLSEAGVVVLDGTSDYAAQAFVAPATPLYQHTVFADRSSVQDPPTLGGSVARNSDNQDRTGESITRRVAFLRNQYIPTPANLDDEDQTTRTGNLSMPADGTYYELAVWDFGSDPVRLSHYYITTFGSGTLTHKFQGSNDDSSWTDLTPELTNGAKAAISGAPVGPYRYIRWLGKTSSFSPEINELVLSEFLNEGADVPGISGDAIDAHISPDILPDSTKVRTNGQEQKEIWKVDFEENIPIAKVVLNHNTSVTSSLISLILQVSQNGTDWTTLATLASANGGAIDTIYVPTQDIRYIRVLVDDQRTASSNNADTELDEASVIQHTDTANRPLIGDELKGSPWTWSVNNLVEHPALFEVQEYPAPRLTIITGKVYWFLYKPGSGASADKYWHLSYGTDATAQPALRSTNAGASWSAPAANAVLRHRTLFNAQRLQGTASDAASQSKFSGVVPGGVLRATIFDESLTTQDMVDREAQALVTARSSLQQVIQIPTPLRLDVVVGAAVTLSNDLEDLGYPTGDHDVVEATHDILTGTSLFTLGDHSPDQSQGDDYISGSATRRTA